MASRPSAIAALCWMLRYVRGWDGAGRGGEVSARRGEGKNWANKEGDYRREPFLGGGPERAGIGARRDVACAAIRACLPHRPE